MSTRLALIGANGHGMSHRRHIAPMHEAGQVDLVAFADVNPVVGTADAPVPPGARIFTDYRELLAEAKPEVVVVCTPPHTHLAIATAALRMGADVLLEKPPVLSLADHRALTEVVTRTGRAVQVGFQALASPALVELSAAVAGGALGRVTGIATVASWQRADAYYQRSPWAGRRTLNGVPVLDGALVNPLAHALMQSLALAEAATGAPARLTTVELERYRARPIEVDDTASLRATLDTGLPVVAAVTLCGEDFIAGEVIVHGTKGRAVLEYPTDRLALPGEPGLRQVPGRLSLLANLLEHRRDPAGVALIVPLARTDPFTALCETIANAPLPTMIDERFLSATGAAPDRHVVVSGVNAAARAAGERLALFSELGDVPWAASPVRVTLDNN